MKRLNLFFKNALILGSATILMRFIAVAFNAYAANRIGAEGIGLYSLITSVYMFAVTFSVSGVNLAVTRLVSEQLAKGEKKAAISALRRCCVYGLCFGCTAGIALFFSADLMASRVLCDVRTAMSLRALSVSLPFISLSTVFAGYFNAVHRIIKSAASSLMEQFVKISVTVFLLSLLMPRGMEYACLALVLGTSLSEGLSFLYLLIFYIFDKKKHLSGADGEIPAGLTGKMFSIALPIALSSYLRSGLVTIEHILIPGGLRKYGADASSALASYGVIHGMVFPVLLFPSAVNSTFASLIVPELSELRAVYGDIYGNRHICYVVKRALRLALLFGICAAGIFICFSQLFGEVIYNSAEAGKYIGIFGVLVPVMYLDTAVDGMLKGLNEQLASMKYNILDASVSVALVYILLPRIGILGYVICVFVTELLNASLSLARLLRVTGVRIPILSCVVAPALCIIGSTSVSLMLTRALSDMLVYDTVKLVFGIVCTLCIYIPLLFCLRSLGDEDIVWFKKLACRT